MQDDFATVGMDYFARQAESEPGSLGGLAAGMAAPEKPFKYSRLILVQDSGPGVSNDNADLPALTSSLHDNPPVRLIELHGIPKQVVHRRAEEVRVTLNPQPRLNLSLERQFQPGGENAGVLHCVLKQIRQVDVFPRELELTRVRLGKEEEIASNALQPLRLFEKNAKHLLLLRAHYRKLQRVIQFTLHDRQRRLQLM